MNEAFCLGPESHSDSIPFKECQNYSNVSDGIWFPEKNVNRSNGRFRFHYGAKNGLTHFVLLGHRNPLTYF